MAGAPRRWIQGGLVLQLRIQGGHGLDGGAPSHPASGMLDLPVGGRIRLDGGGRAPAVASGGSGSGPWIGSEGP
jgi:hypothetical protein